MLKTTDECSSGHEILTALYSNIDMRFVIQQLTHDNVWSVLHLGPKIITLRSLPALRLQTPKKNQRGKQRQRVIALRVASAERNFVPSQSANYCK